MERKISHEMNTYHILVQETLEHHITEWFGSLTLIPQENGVTCLDISFIDQQVKCDSQDQSWDPNINFLSIEYLEHEDHQEVDA